LTTQTVNQVTDPRRETANTPLRVITVLPFADKEKKFYQAISR